MKKILVIGGGGFIGSHLIEKLLNCGFLVRALVRSTVSGEPLVSLGAEVSLGDILDINSLKTALTGIDVVFCVVNVKTYGRSRQEHEREMCLVHVQGTKNLIVACRECGVRRIIYFSSVAAIGYKKGVSVYDQYSQTLPVDAYGKAKLAAERILYESINRKELDVTIVRPVGVFGERGLGPLGKVVFFVKKGTVPVLGKGCNRQSISYAGNIVEEAIFLASRGDTIGKTYILSDENPYTVNELIDAVSAALKKSPLKIHIPLWLVRFGVACANYLGRIILKREIINPENITAIITERIFDASELFKGLGFRQEYNLDEAVGLTIDWLKKERCRKK